MTEAFPIVPGSGRGFWLVAGIALLLLAVLGVLAYTAWSMKHAGVELDRDALRIHGDLWGRTIPRAALRSDAAEIVDLDQRSELAPRWRTLGTGLPGFASGWFRLANGDKALVLLTQRSRVLYLPTHDGYSLLLSVKDPERLLASLRAGI